MRTDSWSPAQIPDLTGRTAVVTGANSGVGLHTGLELARHGAEVVLACRDARRGEAALAWLHTQVPNARAQVRRLDLSDLSSVREFAAATRGAHPRLDLLVNNAGIMALPTRELSVDGFELQLATNHLGHFALTGLLLPALLAAPSRVVSVSSNAHHLARAGLTGLRREVPYRPWAAYGQTKLANLLFTMELQRRADRAGVELTSVAAHPGFSATKLVSSGPGAGRRFARVLMGAATHVLGQPARVGAWPVLYAATMPDLRGAEYVGPGGPGGWRGAPARTAASPAAYDPDQAAQLWQESVELTAVAYDAWA